MASWTVYLITTVVAILGYVFFKRPKWKLPTGPLALPLIGNGLDLAAGPHVACMKWGKKYGGICTIWLGSNRSILLSDPKLVREAYNDPCFSGRPDDEIFTLLPEGPHGVLASEGQVWSEQRRYTLRHLRDFGFGKNTGEELIVNELRELIGNMTKEVGKPLSMNRSFNVAVLNTLWMILSGVRYDQDDPRLWAILNQNKELAKKFSKNPALIFAPKLAKLMPELSGWNMLLNLVNSLKAVVNGHINRHLEDINYDDNPRDFIDAYLHEIQSTTDPSSSFYKDNGLRSLRAIVGDLFGAGSETTSLTLLWLILFTSKFQQVQEKLHKELDQVVGKSRSPCLADRPKLPYTEAVIAETMRMSSIVPMGVFHRAMQDSTFHGYDIPKGTWVTPNLYFIHRDPKIWGNPEEFEAERFLSADGKSFKKHDALMPFGIGKRQCLGETLARDTIFLYFTNIFHRFQIVLAEESKDVPIEPKQEFLLEPQDFKVILCERQ